MVEALKDLDTGMATVRRELEAERDDPTPPLSDQPAASSEAPVSQRQAVFENSLAAAAAGGSSPGRSIAGSDGAIPEEEEAPPASFVDLLERFMRQAEDRQRELKEVAQESQAAVASTVAWLGESPDLDALPVLQTVRAFATEFDQAFAKVYRLVGGEAGAGGGPGSGAPTPG